MRRLLFIALLLLCGCLALPQLASAQYYTWVDTLALTTAQVDSAFLYRWEECTVRPVGCAIYLKVGSPDTSSWDNRKWLYLNDGESVEFGFRTPLVRLALKAASGNGTVYFAGYKRRPQYPEE
ncbi:MAG: hypothetical protein GX421_12490 [Caldisericales bacterium]|nr:hypothetical protein [Caldisericales bacterium]